MESAIATESIAAEGETPNESLTFNESDTETGTDFIRYWDISGLLAVSAGTAIRSESTAGVTADRLSARSGIESVSAGVLNARASGGAADAFLRGPALAPCGGRFGSFFGGNRQTIGYFQGTGSADSASGNGETAENGCQSWIGGLFA